MIQIIPYLSHKYVYEFYSIPHSFLIYLFLDIHMNLLFIIIIIGFFMVYLY